MRHDPRGLPVSTASAAALAASERALWRTMSFYGTPIDDCDAAIANFKRAIELKPEDFA